MYVCIYIYIYIHIQAQHAAIEILPGPAPRAARPNGIDPCQPHAKGLLALIRRNLGNNIRSCNTHTNNNINDNHDNTYYYCYHNQSEGIRKARESATACTPRCRGDALQ